MSNEGKMKRLEREVERLRAQVDFFERTMVPEEDLRVMTDARDMWRRSAEEKQARAVEQGREVERLQNELGSKMDQAAVHYGEVIERLEKARSWWEQQARDLGYESP